MIDQLIIGNKGSYDLYGASVAERHISAPKKKTIKETVPFSNQTYDFSGINGEVYWEERTLEYIFEILEDTPELLEEKKIAFKSWVMNIRSEKIFDPFIKNFHFVGTYDDIDFDDSEIEKSTITVTFKAYPYMISNTVKETKTAVTTSGKTFTIQNGSSHRIVPTFICDVPFTLSVSGGSSFSIPSGEITDEQIMFDAGANTVTVKAASTSGTLIIKFNEEVF